MATVTGSAGERGPLGGSMADPIGLGMRLHSWSAVVVAVSGTVGSPVVIHRDHVTLLEDPVLREPYHAAVGRPLDEAQALIESVAETAASAAAMTLTELASSLGSVATVGLVGGDRRVQTDLPKILASHARLHAAERNLYEQAIIEGASRAGLPVTAVPATGKLFDHASQALGVPLEPSLAALGKALGPPWQKDHKEATAVALVALGRISV
ncbi:MAG TPA: hypothetical protein VE990_02915 [Acidimicrobiales bacterium]|nr:hypothetical protein [Acidimicrobiales bacterium]